MVHFYEIEDMICFAKKHKFLYIYGATERQEYLLKFLDFCGVKVDGYIDIYKAKNFEEIAKFMATPPPFCRYCDVKNRICHSPWKRSSKKLEEYV